MPGAAMLVATRDDVDRLVWPVVLAFGSDPFVRWLFADTTGFTATFPRIVQIHAETVVDHGGAYRSSDFCAVALWYPPSVEPDGAALGAVFSQAVGGAVLDDLSAVLEQMGKSKPGEPHMYLRMIGVDPALQGRGYGSALMDAALEECDRRRLPAYLEATSLGSRALYERHGFSVTSEIQVGEAPPIWPMTRPAPRPPAA